MSSVDCGTVCYDHDARPPAPPRVTGSASGNDLVLAASDGSRFAAYLATPEHPTGARAVMLPDARGLSAFYRDLAVHFAETGTAVLAIDYFGRTAGSQARSEDFDSGPHLAELRRETLLRDVGAAVGYLEAHGTGPTFVVGFCMGGGTALHAATTGLRLAGVVCFYGWTGELGKDPALPQDFAAGIRCPVLGLFGDADQAIPVAVPRALDECMKRAGVPHEIVIYPGEPHGFFELHQMGEAGHQSAATDAWRRSLDFLARQTAPPAHKY